MIFALLASFCLLLADAQNAAAPNAPAANAPAPNAPAANAPAANVGGANAPGGLQSLIQSPIPLIGMLVLLGYFMLFRPERQKQAAIKAMLANLKKSDRVVTAGGIRGIVSNVHREADEVTVTVDETTGTKLRLTISSILRVENDAADAEKK